MPALKYGVDVEALLSKWFVPPAVPKLPGTSLLGGSVVQAAAEVAVKGAYFVGAKDGFEAGFVVALVLVVLVAGPRKVMNAIL